MRTVLIVIALLLSMLTRGQDRWSPGQKEVKQTIEDFFDGFHNRDSLQLRRTMDSQIVMHTIAKTKDGKAKLMKGDISAFLAAVSKRSLEVEWEERLLDFKIDANTEIAQVWTPYEFYINKEFSHCGVNIFQLYHNGERWRIIAITDTRKKEGCL